MNETNTQLILANYPDGEFTDDTFEIVESEIPEPGKGEFLVRNLFLSLDPANRLWAAKADSNAHRVEIGDVMRGFTVSRVVASNHADFKVGDLVQGQDGWQNYAISNGVNYNKESLNKEGLVDTWNISNIVRAGLPASAALSVLGHTGLPPYHGLFNIAKIQPGQTVLVSGAAGAVGTVVGQLAKIAGCRAVGIAGGPEKCSRLIEEFGFDAAVDYKNDDIDSAIARTCPDGVDIFFDNIGGEILNTALAHINIHACVLLCGAISQYTKFGQSALDGPANYLALISKRARMEGFIILDHYVQSRGEMEGKMIDWIKEGKIKFQDEIENGLENAPRVVNKLYRGENKGKLIIRIAESSEIEESVNSVLNSPS